MYNFCSLGGWGGGKGGRLGVAKRTRGGGGVGVAGPRGVGFCAGGGGAEAGGGGGGWGGMWAAGKGERGVWGLNGVGGGGWAGGGASGERVIGRNRIAGKGLEGGGGGQERGGRQEGPAGGGPGEGRADFRVSQRVSIISLFFLSWGGEEGSQRVGGRWRRRWGRGGEGSTKKGGP